MSVSFRFPQLVILAVSWVFAACGGSVATSPSTVCPSGDACLAIDASGDMGGLDAALSPDTTTENEVSTSDVGATSDAPIVVDGSTTPSSVDARILNYGVLDARFSAALSSIVMISMSPNPALYVHSVATGTDQQITLPSPPLSLALDKAGLHAVVGYTSWAAAWIDLQSLTITTVCNVSFAPTSVAVTNAGLAYAMADDAENDQPLSMLDLTKCAETRILASSEQPGGQLQMHPDEADLFVVSGPLSSPSRIDRCFASPYFGCDTISLAFNFEYDFCNKLWLSTEGERAYTGCGVVLAEAADVAEQWTYGATIANGAGIVSLADAPTAQKVVVIPQTDGTADGGVAADSSADEVVRVYEIGDFGFVEQFALPPFDLASPTPAHGLFVFTTPTLDAIYVVTYAEEAMGGPGNVAVVTIHP